MRPVTNPIPHCSILFGLSILLLIQFNPTQGKANAQVLTLNPFYVASENQNDQTATVWRIDTGNNTAQAILSLNSTNSPIVSSSFPQDELKALNTDIQSGSVPSSATSDHVIPSIVGLWTLDPTHVLVEENTSDCYNTSGEYCYGFYEYLLIDATNAQSVNSLLKIGYHSQITNTWTNCASGILVHVSETAVDPLHKRFAFLVEPQSSCLNVSDQPSTLVVVDYSVAPISQLEIPMALGMVWSPDGIKLAYYQTTGCNLPPCDIAIKTYSLLNGATSKVTTITKIPNPGLEKLAWSGNQTVVYQTFVAIPNTDGDVAPRLVAHNMQSGAEVGYNLQQPLVSEIPYLAGTKSDFVASYGDGTALAFSLNGALTVDKTFQPSYQLFANNRYPDVILLSQHVDNLSQLTAIDSKLNEHQVDLSQLLPASETIIDVSPAGVFRAPSGATPTNQSDLTLVRCLTCHVYLYGTVLLTKAIILPSGDHDGTFIVP